MLYYIYNQLKQKQKAVKMKVKTNKLGIIEVNNFKELIETLNASNIAKNTTLKFINSDDYTQAFFSTILNDYKLGFIK